MYACDPTNAPWILWTSGWRVEGIRYWLRLLRAASDGAVVRPAVVRMVGFLVEPTLALPT
jgi:hypothetical protein